MDKIFFNSSEYKNLTFEFVNGLHLCSMKNELKEKILLIHGTQLSASYLYPLMQELYDKGFEPWALDLQGHGQSHGNPLKTAFFWSLKNLPLPSYVEDVKKALSISKASFLLGHSMGGFLGLKVATTYDLKGLILVCTVPPNAIKLKIKKSYYILLYALIAFPFLLFRKKSPFKKLIAKKYAFNKTENEIFELLQEERKKEFINKRNNTQEDTTPEGIIPNLAEYGNISPSDISCKIKVIGSQYDLMTPEKIQHKLATYYNAECFIIPRAAHMPMIENKETRDVLTQEITKFLLDNK